MTRHKWKRIHVKLEQDIEEGVLTMGEQLPTEPVLAAQFGVGRHSVRRAIEALARQGKVEVLQGRGTL
jgi:Transcriptional regulators